MIDVTIIVPMYNVQDYIVRCMKSVADQDFNGCIECILVDDCSLDETVLRAQTFINQYQGGVNFRILRHQINKRQGAARNTGIKESQGKWIIFLDGDDWLDENCISSHFELVAKYPDVEATFAGIKSTIGDSPLSYANKDLCEYIDNKEWIVSAFCKKNVLTTSPCNRMIRKDLILENNLFFFEKIALEDEIWNYQISKYLRRIAIECKDTYCYYIRTDGTMGSMSKDVLHRIQSLITMWNIEIKHLQVSDDTNYINMIWNDILSFQTHYSLEDKKKIRELIVLLIKYSCRVHKYLQALGLCLTLPLTNNKWYRGFTFDYFACLRYINLN